MNERDIFLAAIEIADPAQRDAFVEEACDADAGLRAQVQALLRNHAQASQFLETPAAVKDASMARTLVASSAFTDDNPETGRASGEAEFRQYLQPATRPGWLGRLGHYEIEAILGRGAFGIVAKAFDEKLHRVVAIKLMNPELASTSPPRKRFLREARTAAAVTHENIVAIYAVEEEPIPYLVMEYIAGQTLQQRMEAKGPFEVGVVLRIGQQVAAGLAAAHAAKLIHRDIKPSNILLTDGPAERAKISDFGLARAVDDATMTSSGVIAGTPLYMAPEQARGEPLDHRADLFSLGSVLYQMASGRPPFRAANTVAVLKRVCEDTPRSLDDVIPGIPVWLEAIVFKLLEKQRDERYQTAQEVAELLSRCQRELELYGHVSCVEGRFIGAETQAFPSKKPMNTGATLKPTGWGIATGRVVAAACAIAAALGLLLMLMPRGNEKPRIDASGSATANAGPSTTETPASRPRPTGWHGWPTNAPQPAIAPFDAEQAKRHQDEWAASLKVPVEYTNSIGMTFRLIPPGQFTMGSTVDEAEAALKDIFPIYADWHECVKAEAPRHPVILTQPIYLSLHETTQAQYEKIIGTNPSHFSVNGENSHAVAGLDTADHPVETVSWNDAVDFCVKLSTQEKLRPFYFRTDATTALLNGTGYRLPSEAEWEFACRAGTATKFCSGDQEEDLRRVGWFIANAGRRPHRVGELPTNPFGLHDMHGNVWEWVQDGWDAAFYEQFQQTPAVDPHIPFATVTRRVLRGGDCRGAASFSRSSGRRANEATLRIDFNGFRLALPVETVRQQIASQASTIPTTPVRETLADYYARNRRAAEKALSVGGPHASVGIEIQNPFEWRTVTAGQPLPETAFLVRAWSIKGSPNATNSTLDVLAGLRHLYEINIMAPGQLDAGYLPTLAGLRSPLKELGIGHTRVKTSDLAQLPLMPQVHLLWISSDQVDDGWQFLDRFPALRQIEMYGGPLPDLRPLSQSAHLRRLRMAAWGPPPADPVIEDIQVRNPHLRLQFQVEDQLSILGHDPGWKAARRLVEAGIPVSYFDTIGQVHALSQTDDEAPLAIRYFVLSIPRDVVLTDELRSLLTHVDLNNLTAEGLSATDSLVTVLRNRQDIDHLSLANSDLTDEGLSQLHRLTGLRSLNLTRTSVTSAGVAGFHRAVPGCSIITNTGEVRPDHLAIPQPSPGQ